ncbi:hypothetical protein B0T22DRAFT_481626 [Podospora appendiculata]|uniref:Uncharacterized protein n=1 Tax=Podospora appendiculata TaxID=314037 RepID=A0AAE0XDA1_9PEZI|nr:hypothetical protein B0T22DRAFT_481626 [Podospora appendiculata]
MSEDEWPDHPYLPSKNVRDNYLYRARIMEPGARLGFCTFLQVHQWLNSDDVYPIFLEFRQDFLDQFPNEPAPDYREVARAIDKYTGLFTEPRFKHSKSTWLSHHHWARFMVRVWYNGQLLGREWAGDDRELLYDKARPLYDLLHAIWRMYQGKHASNDTVWTTGFQICQSMGKYIETIVESTFTSKHPPSHKTTHSALQKFRKANDLIMDATLEIAEAFQATIPDETPTEPGKNSESIPAPVVPV